jgi:hypothetical protein
VKPYLENTHHNRTIGVAQGVVPEFKPQNHKKQKQTNKKKLEKAVSKRTKSFYCYFFPYPLKTKEVREKEGKK